MIIINRHYRNLVNYDVIKNNRILQWTIEHGPGPAEFGVLGTPTIILFYGRQEIARYNGSDVDHSHMIWWTKTVTRLGTVFSKV